MIEEPEKKLKKKRVKKETHKKMYRGGKVAKVHIDEVENYKKGNWSLKCAECD
jgi:hypothetical protein